MKRLPDDQSDKDNKCVGCPYENNCRGLPSIERVMRSDGKRIARFRRTEIERLLFFEPDTDNGESDKEQIGVDDIVFMLDENGKHHSEYFLYTTVSAMRGIFSKSKLHLTRASEMNDQLEFVHFDKERWSRIYMACFSYDKNESMGMWSMYGGKPEESVRLSFPRKDLIEQFGIWNRNLPFHLFKAEKDASGAFSYVPLRDVKARLSLHDILYQHEGRKHVGFVHYQGMYSGSKRAAVFQDARKCHKLTSYVKDAIWEYEKEVRLVLEVEEPIRDDCAIIALDVGKMLEGVSVLLGPHESKETRVRDILTSAGLKPEDRMTLSPAKVKFKTSGIK